MVLERDNPAERLARIDKLMADMRPTPGQQQIARAQASLMVVSLLQGPSLDTRDLPEAETGTRGGTHRGQIGPGSSMTQPSTERRFRRSVESAPPCRRCASPRATRVGVVDDVDYFRCADCDGVFTIPRTARAGDTDDDPHEET